MRYCLTTRWHLDAPIERIWDALIAVHDWPRWWPSVRRVVDLERGNADGSNALRRYVFASHSLYRVAFDMRTTAVRPPTLMEGMAAGDLNGTGRCRLIREGRTTRVQYDWQVATGPRWMNLLAPALAPVFRWNHNRVMAEGGRGLARHLRVTLLAFDVCSPLPRRRS